MTAFTVWTSVVRLGSHSYVARACALPCGGILHCAPEERSAECPTRAAAQVAAEALAEALAGAIRARGNEAIVEDCALPSAGWVGPRSAELPATRPRALSPSPRPEEAAEPAQAHT